MVLEFRVKQRVGWIKNILVGVTVTFWCLSIREPGEDRGHSCVSVLINNGASIIIVAKYLGHAKIDETLNTYSHLFKNKMDEIVKTMDNLE